MRYFFIFMALMSILIYSNSLKMFSGEDRVVFLGGDHSVSFSIGKAFFDYCNEKGKEGCLIIFDAHADFRDSWNALDF